MWLGFGGGSRFLVFLNEGGSLCHGRFRTGCVRWLRNILTNELTNGVKKYVNLGPDVNKYIAVHVLDNFAQSDVTLFFEITLIFQQSNPLEASVSDSHATLGHSQICLKISHLYLAVTDETKTQLLPTSALDKP